MGGAHCLLRMSLVHLWPRTSPLWELCVSCPRWHTGPCHCLCPSVGAWSFSLGPESPCRALLGQEAQGARATRLCQGPCPAGGLWWGCRAHLLGTRQRLRPTACLWSGPSGLCPQGSRTEPGTPVYWVCAPACRLGGRLVLPATLGVSKANRCAIVTSLCCDTRRSAAACEGRGRGGATSPGDCG